MRRVQWEGDFCQQEEDASGRWCLREPGVLFRGLSFPKRRSVMQIRQRKVPAVWLLGGAAILLLLIGAAVWQSGQALGQSFSIGFVDMKRAFDSHPRKVSSERALAEFDQAKQREFQQRAKDLSPAQRQDLYRQLQQQFVQKEDELRGGLTQDIRAAVEKVGHDRGITIIMDRQVVLYGGVDLTDAVIAQLTSGK